MHDDTGLDNELAAFTDALLAGQDVPPTSPELDELARVVRQLQEVIAPDTHLDSAYRDRLTQRLNREWTLQHERRTVSWRSNRLVQLTALAAAILVTLLALVLLATTGDSKPVQGTALGSFTGAAAVAVVVVGLGLVIIWYWRRRHL